MTRDDRSNRHRRHRARADRRDRRGGRPGRHRARAHCRARQEGAHPRADGRLGTLPADQRKAFGQAVNGLKARVGEALEGRKAELERGALSARLATEKADITLPVRLGPLQDGRIHPVSQVFDEVAEIFGDMGFAIAEGPDIETDDYNFTKLNIPPEHPARQEHDTFYMKGTRRDGDNHPVKVLRTHTSPVQIRTMMSQKPPIRIIVPGRVYRMDSDATHTPMFHQIEGLVIDETTHLGPPQMVPGGVLQGLLRGRRGAHALPRLAFPVHRAVDGGRHRRRGHRQAGAVAGDLGQRHGAPQRHPQLRPRSRKYQGFAFGMGLDRITMLKYGIPDLRDMFSADLRWLRHYGFTALDVPTLAAAVAVTCRDSSPPLDGEGSGWGEGLGTICAAQCMAGLRAMRRYPHP